MLTMQKGMHIPTDKELYNTLLDILEKEFEDFADAQNRYENTTRTLQAELGEDAAPSVEDVMNAIRQQTVSNLLFSSALGIKANWDHFMNPVARNFMDVEPDIYLREDTARRLPNYAQAQRVLDRFYGLLSPDHRLLYDDIRAYICYLETAVPKLAHYFGFLLGNRLLPRVLPGHHVDMGLTERYKTMINSYFGKSINLF